MSARYITGPVSALPSWGYALLAAVGCLLLGVSWAATLTRRVTALCAWARALARMEAGLSLRAHTLEELLSRAAEGEENRDVRATLLACAGQMRDDPLSTLEEAIAKRPMPELKDTDRAVLSPLWTTLGTGDEASQRGLIRAVRSALDTQVEQARDAESRDKRLALWLGVIGGCAVFLFLL